MSIIAIHQPNFLPFYGFFSKIANCDHFVLLDDAQYEKGSFINRVKIFDRSRNEGTWLTCPLSNYRFGMKIDEIKIEPSQFWKTKHLKSLQINYGKSKYYSDVYDLIKQVYMNSYDKLVNLNIDLIFCISDYLGIPHSRFHRSSTFNLESKSNERLIQITQLLKCDIYLHGKGAIKYHDPHLFEEQNIHLKLTNQTISYSQFGKEFIPYLSVLDLLFHHGKDSIHVLTNELK